jgi:hypothetical protein
MLAMDAMRNEAPSWAVTLTLPRAIARHAEVAVAWQDAKRRGAGRHAEFARLTEWTTGYEEE